MERVSISERSYQLFLSMHFFPLLNCMLVCMVENSWPDFTVLPAAYIYIWALLKLREKKNKQIRKILGRRKWICLPFSCGIAWGWTHRAHILQTVSRHLDLVHKGWSGKNIESHAFKAWNQTNKKIFILFSDSQHTHGPGVAVWKLYLLQNLSNK